MSERSELHALNCSVNKDGQVSKRTASSFWDFMRKLVLLLSVSWMIPWWLLAQVLRVIICLTVGMQNLWWHPIYEAKDSWDSNNQ